MAVTFDGVRVPESTRLAAEGDGFRIAMQARARPACVVMLLLVAHDEWLRCTPEAFCWY